MLTSDFNFDLPEELIAQHPSGVRGQDKLMLLNRETGEVEHHMMDDLPDLIEPGTLMVFIETHIFAQTQTNAVVPLLDEVGTDAHLCTLNRRALLALVGPSLHGNGQQQPKRSSANDFER